MIWTALDRTLDRLRPWRLVLVPAAQRERLGQAFADALRERDPRDPVGGAHLGARHGEHPIGAETSPKEARAQFRAGLRRPTSGCSAATGFSLPGSAQGVFGLLPSAG